MDSFFFFDTINLKWYIVFIEGSNKLLPNIIAFLIFILANRVDPDEMPHYAAFHLDLHCLPKYAFRSHLYTEG